MDVWASAVWHMGLAALWPVESSWIRDQTCVPCIGHVDSQPLDHQRTFFFFLFLFFDRPLALFSSEGVYIPFF